MGPSQTGPVTGRLLTTRTILGMMIMVCCCQLLSIAEHLQVPDTVSAALIMLCHTGGCSGRQDEAGFPGPFLEAEPQRSPEGIGTASEPPLINLRTPLPLFR